MINPNYTYALIGASTDPQKYGYQVFADLTAAGYRVLPVNLKGGQLLGHHVYRSLLDISEPIDVVIMVVPPVVALNELKKVVFKEIKKVWFQPGSESQENLDFCQQHQLQFVYGACLMKSRLKLAQPVNRS